MNAAQAVFGDELGEGISMPRPAHKTRQDWLGSLRVGSSVNMVTPCGIHSAVVERYEDGRLWVMWSLGVACDLGYSATWVDPLTGTNASGDYRIEPVAAEIVKRESFND